MKRVALTLCAWLPVFSGCDKLTPQLNVNVQFYAPCDQQPMDNVGTMKVMAEDEDGQARSTQASKSKGSLKLGSLKIANNTQVFGLGYVGDVADDPGVLDKEPIAAGASVPLDLASYVKDNALPAPAARQYPNDSPNPLSTPSGKVSVPMGKAFTFASTTDADAKTCSGMMQARHGHTATFIGGANKVLILGGMTYAESDGAEAFVPKERAVEIYDPATGTYKTVNTGAMQPLMQRAYHSATALPDGAVLVWGGIGPEGDGSRVSARAISFVLAMDSKENVTVTTLAAAQGFTIKRFHHQATLLKDGTGVVITGGCGCTGGTLSAAQIKAGQCLPATESCADGQPRVSGVEIFDPNSYTIRTVGTVLTKARAFHTATALEGGRVIVAGGDDGTSPISEVEMVRMRGSAGQPDVLVTGDLLDTSRVTHAAAVGLSNEECDTLGAGSAPEGECVLITGGCLSLPVYAVPANGNAIEATCPDAKAGSTVIDFGPAAGSRVRAGPQPMAGQGRWDHEAYHLGFGSQMVVVLGGRLQGGSTPAGDTEATAELLARKGALDRPFAKPSFLKVPRRRFATAEFPSGQLLVTGGVPPEIGSEMPASIGTAELFFFPFR